MAPLCKSILPPSESTCYCGLNHHPEFKHEWEESISLMNTYQLDEILVTKFRNLWKEWTTLVRKQRLDRFDNRILMLGIDLGYKQMFGFIPIERISHGQ